jgi:hypothetical protein
MSDPPQRDALRLEDEFRRALEDCEDLYRSSALEYARTYPELLGVSPREFVQRTLNLYRGLVLKIFVEIAYINRRWTAEELGLAYELYDHLWGRQLGEEQLREALARFQEQTGLTWDALIGPFERLLPFRRRAAQLQTVVMRIANCVAKVDGHVGAEEVRALQWIQAEMQRVLERVPLYSREPEPLAQAPDPPPVRDLPFENSAPRTPDDAPLRMTGALETRAPEQQLAEALAELDELIGLDAIKQEVRGLVNFLKMQAAREQFDLPQTRIGLHAVFEGNAGTGKTTVARLLGRIFGAMGLVSRGHLVETDRSGLVAEYAGQTAPKTNRKIDEALDGVLFIDEAYSLAGDKGDDAYGAEALQTLLKRMEDDRDRLIVVLAGYPEPLERMLKSNPGLSSRFSRQFTFPDYSATELGSIFEVLCRKNRYELPALTRVKLLLGFQFLLDQRDEHFGNGRLARNVFERAIGRLANRIAGVAPLTRELLTTLQPEDIVMEDVPPSVWTDLASPARRFRVTCPSCRQASRLAASLLGRKVQCKRCRKSFQADWGDVLGAES